MFGAHHSGNRMHEGMAKSPGCEPPDPAPFFGTPWGHPGTAMHHTHASNDMSAPRCVQARCAVCAKAFRSTRAHTWTAASTFAGDEMFGSLSIAMTEMRICSTPRMGRHRSSADSCNAKSYTLTHTRRNRVRSDGHAHTKQPHFLSCGSPASELRLIRHQRRIRLCGVSTSTAIFTLTYRCVILVYTRGVENRDANLAIRVDCKWQRQSTQGLNACVHCDRGT